MNENISAGRRPEKVFVVLSIRQLRRMLASANLDSKQSSVHPGKINLNHCLSIEADLLPEENDLQGVGHISAVSFEADACKYLKG